MWGVLSDSRCVWSKVGIIEGGTPIYPHTHIHIHTHTHSCLSKEQIHSFAIRSSRQHLPLEGYQLSVQYSQFLFTLLEQLLILSIPPQPRFEVTDLCQKLRPLLVLVYLCTGSACRL